MSAGVRLVLVTAPPDEAAALARRVVEEGLAACANLLAGVVSVYRWRGKVEEAGETLIIMKTSQTALDALKARVSELHPYEVPEFLVLPVEGGLDAYLEWVVAETGGEG